MKALSLVLLLCFCTSTFACGAESKLSPFLEQGKYGGLKLFIPLNHESMELVAVLFLINDGFSLPVKYFAKGEYPDHHKEGFATVVFEANSGDIEKLEVIARFKDPIGPNGEINFCFHDEKFKVHELI